MPLSYSRHMLIIVPVRTVPVTAPHCVFSRFCAGALKSTAGIATRLGLNS
ncbi:hypothetical protein [Shewanella sp. NFH-SH190041]|nr:hypothetical protein [Shewanella sp. NFH-SH190041]